MPKTGYIPQFMRLVYRSVPSLSRQHTAQISNGVFVLTPQILCSCMISIWRALRRLASVFRWPCGTLAPSKRSLLYVVFPSCRRMGIKDSCCSTGSPRTRLKIISQAVRESISVFCWIVVIGISQYRETRMPS